MEVAARRIGNASQAFLGTVCAGRAARTEAGGSDQAEGQAAASRARPWRVGCSPQTDCGGHARASGTWARRLRFGPCMHGGRWSDRTRRVWCLAAVGGAGGAQAVRVIWDGGGGEGGWSESEAGRKALPLQARTHMQMRHQTAHARGRREGPGQLEAIGQGRKPGLMGGRVWAGRGRSGPDWSPSHCPGFDCVSVVG